MFCTSRYAISAEVTLQKFTLTPLSKARLHESAALYITKHSTTALTEEMVLPEALVTAFTVDSKRVVE